jgi:hypothetical protein
MDWLRRFGRFWYDFLVGDRWELFVGPIIVLGLTWVLATAGVSGVVAGAVLFGGVVAVAAISIAATIRSA